MPQVQSSAIYAWGKAARRRVAMETLCGTNSARDTRRRLHFWRKRAQRYVSCELRQRYLTSRRTFYKRQEILQGWRLEATVRSTPPLPISLLSPPPPMDSARHGQRPPPPSSPSSTSSTLTPFPPSAPSDRRDSTRAASPS